MSFETTGRKPQGEITLGWADVDAVDGGSIPAQRGSARIENVKENGEASGGRKVVGGDGGRELALELEEVEVAELAKEILLVGGERHF